MRRKIMQIADTTFVVSLPLKWARSHNVQKGDEVDIEVRQDTLCLNLSSRPNSLSYSFQVDSMPRTAGRYIVSLYRLGYDEVTVKFDDPAYVEQIEKELRENTIGQEIINQAQGTCTIKNMSSSDEDTDRLVRRVWFLILDMARDIKDALNAGNKKELEQIPLREKNVNKFTNHCLRSLMRGQDSRRIPILYHYVRSLEILSDGLKEIAQGKKTDCTELVKMLEDFYDLYYSYAPAKSEGLITSLEKLKASTDNPGMIRVLSHIKSMISVVIELQLLD